MNLKPITEKIEKANSTVADFNRQEIIDMIVATDIALKNCSFHLKEKLKKQENDQDQFDQMDYQESLEAQKCFGALKDFFIFGNITSKEEI